MIYVAIFGWSATAFFVWLAHAWRGLFMRVNEQLDVSIKIAKESHEQFRQAKEIAENALRTLAEAVETRRA